MCGETGVKSWGSLVWQGRRKPALRWTGAPGTPANPSDASEMTVMRNDSNNPAETGAIARRARLLGRVLAWPLAAALGLSLGGCGGFDNFTQVYQRGYVLQEGALEQIPLGSSQEQVLIVLGTPSTVATVSGEAFYYISQRGVQTVSFLNQSVTDQRVVAVYFDKQRRVQRLANYGLKDGKVFDFISRTTPTSGNELNYLGYVFAITKPLN